MGPNARSASGRTDWVSIVSLIDTRCECNKGGRKIADEWKLLGYECYKRGLRERELLGQSTTVVQRKKSQSPRPRAPSAAAGRRLGGVCGLRQGRYRVFRVEHVLAKSCGDTQARRRAVASMAYHRSPRSRAGNADDAAPACAVTSQGRRRRPKPSNRDRTTTTSEAGAEGADAGP